MSDEESKREERIREVIDAWHDRKISNKQLIEINEKEKLDIWIGYIPGIRGLIVRSDIPKREKK